MRVSNTILIFLIGFTLLSCSSKDKIVGIWEVHNEYNQATYEIVHSRGKFYGKMHQYTDGKTQYHGNNKKEDYFISDIENKNGEYKNGKMHFPDNRTSNISFVLKDDNTLEVSMMYEGEPYTEIWKRKGTKDAITIDMVQTEDNTSIFSKKVSNKNNTSDSVMTVTEEKKSFKPQPKTQSLENNIVGVWDVKTDYYQAIYEIEKNKEKFIGKVHYYNDGTTEYKGKNKKEDYFLSNVTFKDGQYRDGKMYLPDGSYYQVIFTVKDENTLEAKMTIEGQQYTETWTRNITYK
ncbi:hypothetical protein [Aquimarina sp. 2304DJ70-9]|uniref:hypothetical protein n=1 Tax=Aquimarina penaris TaxID=3231044 RepID=UPI00346221AE